MLTLLLVLWLLSFLISILMIARIWSAGALQGILSLLVPGYIFYALIRYWGHPDHDIRYLMLIQIVLSVALIIETRSVSQQAAAEQALEPAATSSRHERVASAASDPAATASQATPVAPMSKSAPPAPAPSEPTAPAPTAPASPKELRDVAGSIEFFRGRFTRQSIGMQFEIPTRGYRMIDGSAARRMQTALTGVDDAHLIGWVLGEFTALTDPALRPVRLRWLSDGLVVTNPDELDPAGLLAAANSQPHIPRLAGSNGKLLRFAAAPMQIDNVIAWSEERQLENAKKTVFDCYALRLARKGVLEFSLIGLDGGAVRTCVSTLQEFAQRSSFTPTADYPAQTQGNHFAMYSLSGLIAQTQ